VIPVEVTQTPWHYTTFWDWVDHWQTLIAGVLAFAAGFGTVVAAIGAIWVTRSTARKQIDASREEADKVIAATRAQTEATFKQTETTVRLEQERVASEATAFRVMLEAAMVRVLSEVASARKTYPSAFETGAPVSVEALAVRQCITKGAFAELRAACVRQGSPFTGAFLDLEREIDSFALQWQVVPTPNGPFQQGKTAGLATQLEVIKAKATELRQKAAEK
jgi:hypothetical protein